MFKYENAVHRIFVSRFVEDLLKFVKSFELKYKLWNLSSELQE